jgi:hypothetical protein
MLRYTFCDGRSAGIRDQLPTEVISEGGKWVVQPPSNERIPIEADDTLD